jgi:hypothetical protein
MFLLTIEIISHNLKLSDHTKVRTIMKKTPTSISRIGIRFVIDVDVVALGEKLGEEVFVISVLIVMFCSKVEVEVEMLDEGLGEGVEFEGEVIIEIAVPESVEGSLSVGVTVTLLIEIIAGVDSKGLEHCLGTGVSNTPAFVEGRLVKASHSVRIEPKDEANEGFNVA